MSAAPGPNRPLDGVTVAFDLDGTLVDTAPDLVGALNVVLEERGLPHVPQDAARILVGKGARALIARGFALAGEPLRDEEMDGLVPRFIAAYRDRIANESRPFPGLEAALQQLSDEGATLCVCTNKRTDLSLSLLDALGLTRRFRSVTGADKAPKPKPDPSHYITAIAEAGGRMDRSILVGDSANDVNAAHAAGAPVVVVTFGYTDIPASELGGDALIERFEDLPAAIAALAAKPRALPPSAASAIARPS